jgi:hypothetical protein
MKEVLTLLAPTARVPEDAELLLATYQKVLAGKRMLLVLDDARDMDQVHKLIPPEPVASLTTSRSPIALELAKNVALDRLTEDEAIALLREALRDRRDVTEYELWALAERCGYLPLTLSIAGSYLALHPSLAVKDYLNALQEPSGDTRTVTSREAFGFALDHLMQEDMRLPGLYHLLTVFPTGFLLSGAAAVWQMPEAEACKVLKNFGMRALVSRDQSTHRFSS